MNLRATHPPILARLRVVIAAVKPSWPYVVTWAAMLALLSGCSRSSVPKPHSSTRAPKVFHQANSASRPSGAAKENTSRKSLQSYEPTEEQAAATAVVGIGKPAVPELIKTLRSENPTARRQAALALARIGPDARDAVDELIVALDDGDPTVRKAAARALGNIGPAAERAVPYLVRVMSGEPADTTMDDEYSVAPSRVESRSTSAKTLVPPTSDQVTNDQEKMNKATPGRPRYYGSSTDEVTIESGGDNENKNKDVQQADFQSESESTDDEPENTTEDETIEAKTKTSQPPPPSKYSPPSKLRPKGRP